MNNELLQFKSLRSTAISEIVYDADLGLLHVTYRHPNKSTGNSRYTFEDVILADIVTIVNLRKVYDSWGTAFSEWKKRRDAQKLQEVEAVYEDSLSRMSPTQLKHLSTLLRQSGY